MRSMHTHSRRLQTVAFGLCLMLPPAARAELSSDTLLGMGLRSRPAYDGSAAQHEELVPVVRYFGRPWFARSTQGVLEGGARAEWLPGVYAGAQLSYEPGRQPSESAFLERHGLAPIRRGASFGLHLEWDLSVGPMPITLLGRIRRQTDADLGTQADLRLSAGVLQVGAISAGVFTQATWADAKSAGAFYGITAQQSTSTGLPAFAAGSGWMVGTFGLLWSVELSRNWLALGNLEARHQHGDAANSPLTERAWTHAVSAGLAYRF